MWPFSEPPAPILNQMLTEAFKWISWFIPTVAMTACVGIGDPAPASKEMWLKASASEPCLADALGRELSCGRPSTYVADPNMVTKALGAEPTWVASVECGGVSWSLEARLPARQHILILVGERSPAKLGAVAAAVEACGTPKP
jgi:hypothetical protein